MAYLCHYNSLSKSDKLWSQSGDVFLSVSRHHSTTTFIYIQYSNVINITSLVCNLVVPPWEPRRSASVYFIFNLESCSLFECPSMYTNRRLGLYYDVVYSKQQHTYCLVTSYLHPHYTVQRMYHSVLYACVSEVRCMLRMGIFTCM